MSRVITVGHCVECPHNEPNWYASNVYGVWCAAARKAITVATDYPFPSWCPLPESKEESK